VTALPDEDEWGELTEAQFDRVDLVKAGANGIPLLIAKQDADAAGMLPPDYVRSLIAKAEPEPSPGEQVTMTGSPAAIAKLIHEAAQKPPAGVAKAEMSGKSVNDLPDSAFAYIEPGGKKDADGKTTPRKLRHFPIHDKAHADNAAARIAQGAKFGDKAKGKVRAAQRKFGEKVSKEAGDDVAAGAVTKQDMSDGQELDDGIDGMDPTVPLASPGDDAPGDPGDPGSPAWEAIDAATAQKWTSILARSRVALDLLAERELLEAASADPGDAENAWDLQDACCAIDYVISVLAPYAVAEQSESDTGADAMAMIGKAMAGFDPAPLTTIEGIGAVIRKSGRVLSSVNEAEIRSAAASLNKVLQTLPQAPIADDIVTKETAVAADTDKPASEPEDVAKETADDVDLETLHGVSKEAEASVEATNAALAGPGDLQVALKPGYDLSGVTGVRIAKSGLPVLVYDRSGSPRQVDPERIRGQIAKADAAPDADAKTKMVAVFDAKGDLVGVCDPADITPVAGADAPSTNEEKPEDAAPAADPADMTPAPAADAGTPADGVAKEAGETQPAASSGEEDPQGVLKSIVTAAMHEVLGADPAREDIRKQAEVIAAQSGEIEALKARLETVENSPAAPKVFTNGATPPPGTLRGQDRAPDGQPQVDVAKARELKDTLYRGTAPEQNQAAREMQEAAIAQLSAIHLAPRR
jgi:hypothetical protein